VDTHARTHARTHTIMSSIPTRSSSSSSRDAATSNALRDRIDTFADKAKRAYQHGLFSVAIGLYQSAIDVVNDYDDKEDALLYLARFTASMLTHLFCLYNNIYQM